MSTQLTIIRIESADHNAATPLLINGVLRKRIRHNVDTRLDPAELEALSNSNTVFKLVDGASSAQSADGGAERGLSAPPGTPAPERRGARLAVDPFDAKATLAQTIARISEDLDEFSADEIRALIAAEKAGQGRVTLVEALERKLAALGDLAASDRQRPAP